MSGRNSLLWTRRRVRADTASLTLTNQDIKFNAIQGDDVGDLIMTVDGVPVAKTTTYEGSVTQGPNDVTLDNLVVAEDAPIGTVIANIGSTVGSPPFTFTELAPLSPELMIVGTELQVAAALTAGTFDITIGVTDVIGFDYVLQPAFTITATGETLPVDLTGVISHHDASDEGSIVSAGGAVSAWNDQIGSNDWAITTEALKPETGDASKDINGLNTLFFDGTNTMQNLSVNLGDTNWLIWMGRADAQLADAGSTINIFISTEDGGTGTCQNCIGMRDPDTSDLPYYFGGGVVIDGINAINVGDLICMVCNFDKNVRAELFVNGVSEALTTTGSDVANDSERLLLGGEIVGITRMMVGSCAETVFGTGTLTAEEISGIQSYFENKWVP